MSFDLNIIPSLTIKNEFIKIFSFVFDKMCSASFCWFLHWKFINWRFFCLIMVPFSALIYRNNAWLLKVFVELYEVHGRRKPPTKRFVHSWRQKQSFIACWPSPAVTVNEQNRFFECRLSENNSSSTSFWIILITWPCKIFFESKRFKVNESFWASVIHASSSGLRRFWFAWFLRFLGLTPDWRRTGAVRPGPWGPGEPFPFGNKSLQNLSKYDLDMFDEIWDQTITGFLDNLCPWSGIHGQFVQNFTLNYPRKRSVRRSVCLISIQIFFKSVHFKNSWFSVARICLATLSSNSDFRTEAG